MRWRICCVVVWVLAGVLWPQSSSAQTGKALDERLFASIDQEDMGALQAALAGGASLSAHSDRGQTPLVAAAAQGNAAIFRALLEAGANPDEVDANHEAPVIQAAFSDQIDVMRVLLTSRPKLDVQNLSGWSALSLAVNRRDKAMIELLVRAGANVNTVNAKTRHSLLTEAYVSNDDNDLIAMLRSAGARFTDATDELFAAAASADIDEMRRALAAGANVNYGNRYGETPLCVAASKGNTVAVRVLLAAGALPDLTGSDQLTALSWAIFSNHQSTVRALIDGGANVRVLLQNRQTVLMKAAESLDDAELVRYLLGQGIDVNATDTLGQTALMLAAEANHISDVKALLKAGADPSLHDRRGRAAADFAHDRKLDSMAALLAQAEQRAATSQH